MPTTKEWCSPIYLFLLENDAAQVLNPQQNTLTKITNTFNPPLNLSFAKAAKNYIRKDYLTVLFTQAIRLNFILTFLN
jgi:hypothetical protein